MGQTVWQILDLCIMDNGHNLLPKIYVKGDANLLPFAEQGINVFDFWINKGVYTVANGEEKIIFTYDSNHLSYGGYWADKGVPVIVFARGNVKTSPMSKFYIVPHEVGHLIHDCEAGFYAEADTLTPEAHILLSHDFTRECIKTYGADYVQYILLEALKNTHFQSIWHDYEWNLVLDEMMADFMTMTFLYNNEPKQCNSYYNFENEQIDIAKRSYDYSYRAIRETAYLIASDIFRQSKGNNTKDLFCTTSEELVRFLKTNLRKFPIYKNNFDYYFQLYMIHTKAAIERGDLSHIGQS